MYGHSNVYWNSQSHEKSVDIKVNVSDSLIQISAKGGIIKNNLLTVSSYRLTTFNKLEYKLKFIRDQHRKFNFYLICAREIDEANKAVNYLIIKVPSVKLAPSGMLNIKNWEETKTGYELKNDLGFKAKIVFKMSNQLWYLIPLDYFSNDEKLLKISIPVKGLGGGLIDFLNRSKLKK